ncbi:Modification methylase NlaIV (M.NlaIV) (Cytosine-specific methyltransferase NlaIV), partial [Durusdinium trenchii]
TLSRIRAAAEACNEKVAWPNFLINGSNGSSALRVGTDCSGLEAPVHALRSMGLLHKHVFSCEINPAPRTMIEANCLPEEAFMDDVIVSSAGAVPFVHLYVAGFSCKPFSMLHNKTKLLEEKEAEIFKAVLRRIGKLRPPCFVLENVKGIQRCMEKVQSMLQDLGYIVAVQLMDPSSLGEPLLRPRFYFIGLRTDVAAFLAGASRHILQHIWTELGQANEPAPLAQGCSADDLFLHLPRERDVWDKLRTTVGQADQFVCDLSQSLGRNRERTDGKVPTITPGSHLILGSEGRALLPHEALLLHAFPLHKMTFPSCISATDLENMGGNTMHCQVVGIAMVIALLLVNWELPAAHQSLPAAVAASAPSAPLALEAAKRLEEHLRKRFGMQPPTWSKVAAALLLCYGLGKCLVGREAFEKPDRREWKPESFLSAQQHEPGLLQWSYLVKWPAMPPPAISARLAADERDPDNLMLQILHAENSFLRMGESRLSFLDSCRGSFAHSVVKSRGDKLTACLKILVASAKVQKLEVDELSARRPLALLPLVQKFFEVTHGLAQRKAFLPSRVISKRGQKVRPNRALAKLRMADVLAMAGQFLDGSLDIMFVCQGKADWIVDVDMNGTYSKVFGRWCGQSPADTLEAVQEQLKGLPNPKCVKMQILQAEVTSDVCVVNACKCIHVLKTPGLRLSLRFSKWLPVSHGFP